MTPDEAYLARIDAEDSALAAAWGCRCLGEGCSTCQDESKPATLITVATDGKITFRRVGPGVLPEE